MSVSLLGSMESFCLIKKVCLCLITKVYWNESKVAKIQTPSDFGSLILCLGRKVYWCPVVSMRYVIMYWQRGMSGICLPKQVCLCPYKKVLKVFVSVERYTHVSLVRYVVVKINLPKFRLFQTLGVWIHVLIRRYFDTL